LGLRGGVCFYTVVASPRGGENAIRGGGDYLVGGGFRENRGGKTEGFVDRRENP